MISKWEKRFIKPVEKPWTKTILSPFAELQTHKKQRVFSLEKM